MAAALFFVGAALLVIGVAFVYWPAAFIVAGVIGIGAAAFVDLATPSEYEYDDADAENDL